MRSGMGCAAWAAALCLTLGGCGGGGGSGSASVEPATLAATEDALSVAWQGDSSIDVLANDNVSKGTLSLVSVSAPVHGTAVVNDGRILYTPSAGFVGEDSFSYTARADAGGATGSAAVHITVEARAHVVGHVPAALAGAEVTAKVGDASFATMADVDGTYEIELRSMQVSDFVTLSAQGTGSHGAVRLVSLVGDFAYLGTLKPEVTGRLTSAQGVASDLGAVSTVIAALVAPDGAWPATQVVLENGLTKVLPRYLEATAAALQLVIDGDAALPAGVSDTFALASNMAALDALFAAQVASGGAKLQAANATAVAGDSPAFAPPFDPPVGTALVFYSGDGSVGGGEVLTLTAPGRVTVTNSLGSLAGSWNREGGRLNVLLDEPFAFLAGIEDGGVPVNVLITITGYSYRFLAGTPAQGLAQRFEIVNYAYAQGPKAGTTVQVQGLDKATGLVHVQDLQRRLELPASQLAPGARLAGLVATDLFSGGPDGSVGPAQNILRIDSATGAMVEGFGPVGWFSEDRWLSIPLSGATRRFARLLADIGQGRELWLAMDVRDDGSLLDAITFGVVLADPTPSPFTAVNSARRWTGVIWFPSLGVTTIELFSDGSGEQRTIPNGAVTALPIDAWLTDGSGALSIRRNVSSSAYRERLWVPVRRDAGGVWVLESQQNVSSLAGTFALTPARLTYKVDVGAASR